MPDIIITVDTASEAQTSEHGPFSVLAGRYSIVPIENGVRDGEQVIVLKTERGEDLPALVTRSKDGRTAFGRALSVERQPGWDDTTYNVACVYLDAWR